ncbi:hypothetical protein ITJ57_14800 [Plantibacter sp. VKM Ac-2880]|uniref:hypothetical protein n=1 Tax=Plantibacter sp. VKM Ac-2880 TaxID=2783827 RepID=UPI0018903564|nr:hypothetical protein [Plantibacter sp. VKM Ac-2880]MBF4570039.1 hypothetical protein [Plantibacter sp. VKM Ac-2880]
MGIRGEGRRSFGIGAGIAVVVVLTASSCASTAAPGASPTSEAPSSSTSTELLACDDFATLDTVAAVLAAEPADVVEAVQPSDAVDQAVLTAAGGLACSWRVGTAQQSIGDGAGDWAYLSIEILPDAADDWAPPYAGDTPSEDTRTIAGVEATTASGETGWRVSAPVGEAWVDLSITAAGLTSTGSRFDDAPAGEVLDNLAIAAESTFTTVEPASKAQLAWPTLTPREGDATCDGGLDEAGIAAALQYGDTPTTYTVIDPRTQPIVDLEDAASARVGAFSCELFAEGFGYTDILVVRGGATIIDGLAAQPDIAAALEPVALEGAVDGESALVARRSDGPRSPLSFTVGDTFYTVNSGDGARTVAEAIIAQTR